MYLLKFMKRYIALTIFKEVHGVLMELLYYLGQNHIGQELLFPHSPSSLLLCRFEKVLNEKSTSLHCSNAEGGEAGEGVPSEGVQRLLAAIVEHFQHFRYTCQLVRPKQERQRRREKHQFNQKELLLTKR